MMRLTKQACVCVSILLLEPPPPGLHSRTLVTWEYGARTNSGLGFSVAPQAKVEVVSRRPLELSRVCVLQGEAGSWFLCSGGKCSDWEKSAGWCVGPCPSRFTPASPPGFEFDPVTCSGQWSEADVTTSGLSLDLRRPGASASVRTLGRAWESLGPTS